MKVNSNELITAVTRALRAFCITLVIFFFINLIFHIHISLRNIIFGVIFSELFLFIQWRRKRK